MNTFLMASVHRLQLAGIIYKLGVNYASVLLDASRILPREVYWMTLSRREDGTEKAKVKSKVLEQVCEDTERGAKEEKDDLASKEYLSSGSGPDFAAKTSKKTTRLPAKHTTNQWHPLLSRSPNKKVKWTGCKANDSSFKASQPGLLNLCSVVTDTISQEKVHFIWFEQVFPKGFLSNVLGFCCYEPFFPLSENPASVGGPI